MLVEVGFENTKLFEIVRLISEHVHSIDNLFVLGNVGPSHLVPDFFELECLVIVNGDGANERDDVLFPPDFEPEFVEVGVIRIVLHLPDDNDFLHE